MFPVLAVSHPCAEIPIRPETRIVAVSDMRLQAVSQENGTRRCAFRVSLKQFGIRECHR